MPYLQGYQERYTMARACNVRHCEAVLETIMDFCEA
jgi:hypothetical protein